MISKGSSTSPSRLFKDIGGAAVMAVGPRAVRLFRAASMAYEVCRFDS